MTSHVANDVCDGHEYVKNAITFEPFALTTQFKICSFEDKSSLRTGYENIQRCEGRGFDLYINNAVLIL